MDNFHLILENYFPNGIRGFRRGLSVLVFVVIISLTACVTMRIPEDRAQPPETYELKSEQNGLLVAVNPVTNPMEIQKTFRIALLDEKGILPILVLAKNNNPNQNFVLEKTNIAVVKHDSLNKNETELGEVTSGKPGESVAMVGAALPILLFAGLKMMSDADVIKHNLQEKAFYSRTLGFNQEAHGYIYFKLPDGKKTAKGYDVLIQAMNSSNNETITFCLPIR